MTTPPRSVAPKSRESLSPLTTAERLRMFKTSLPSPHDATFDYDRTVDILERMDLIKRYIHKFPEHIERHVARVSTLEIRIYMDDEDVDVWGFRNNEDTVLAENIPITWKATDTSYFQEHLDNAWWAALRDELSSAMESFDKLLVVMVHTYNELNDGHAQLLVVDVQTWSAGKVKTYIVDPNGNRNVGNVLQKVTRSMLFAMSGFRMSGPMTVTYSTVKTPYLNVSDELYNQMHVIDNALRMRKTYDTEIGQCVSVCTFFAFMIATTGRRVLKKGFVERNILRPLQGGTDLHTEMNILCFFRAWSRALVSTQPPTVSFHKERCIWHTTQGYFQVHFHDDTVAYFTTIGRA